MSSPEYLLIYTYISSYYEIINENICVHMDAGFISDM